MKTYTIQEAFEILQEVKITNSIQIVRRWVRNKNLRARKLGKIYTITELDLEVFIDSKMPPFHQKFKRNLEEAIENINEKKEQLEVSLQTTTDELVKIEVTAAIRAYDDAVETILQTIKG